MNVKKNKWVVSAASVALVASAIVPVASAASFSDIENTDHKEAILALAEAGIVSGYTDGTFKPHAVVTRGNVTKFLGKWLVSEGYEIPADFDKEARFNDLPTTHGDQELVKFAALVKDAGVFKGSNNNLMHINKMTREQMAVVLVRAINTVYGVDLVADYKAENYETTITDLDKATANENREAIIALEYAELTKVTAFNPKNSLTRGQFASFLNRTVTSIDKEEAELAVESVNAINGTLTVKLAEKAEAVEVKDFTVSQAINGETATEVTPSAAVLSEDGLTATLTVPQVAAQATTEQSVVYTVNTVAAPAFVVESTNTTVTAVAPVNATTVQLTGKNLNKLTATDVTIDGNAVSSYVAAADGKTATVVFLAAFVPETEYTLSAKTDEGTKTFTFSYKLAATTLAVDEKVYDNDTKNQTVSFTVNGVAGDINELLTNGYTVKFTATNAADNTTANIFKSDAPGVLNDTVAVGEYKVQMTLSKGSDVIVSPVQVIKVQNLENVVSAIESYEFANTSNKVVQKSTTLLVGEEATVGKMEVIINGSKTDAVLGNVKAKSSNPAVISVDANGKLTANTPGTATITLTYGNATKEVTFTVASNTKTRVLTKVTSDSSIVTAIKGQNKIVTLSAVDQYGDLMATEEISASSSNNNVVTVATPATTNAKGEATLAITPVDKGTASILLKNGKGTTIGSIGATVTEVNNVTSEKLEIVKPKTDEDKKVYSEDNTLDLSSDKKVKYQLNQYTSEGVLNGEADFANKYTPSSSDKDIATSQYSADGKTLEITGHKAGTATFTLTPKDGVDGGVKTITVTVVDSGYAIESVNFNTVSKIDFVGKVINYKTVLNTVDAAKDDIVKGITLNKAINDAIRITKNADAKLYIDANGDGELNAQEVVLGTLSLTAVSGSTFTNNFTVMGSATTASKDKGTLVFKITSNDEIVASTSVDVEVK